MPRKPKHSAVEEPKEPHKLTLTKQPTCDKKLEKVNPKSKKNNSQRKPKRQRPKKCKTKNCIILQNGDVCNEINSNLSIQLQIEASRKNEENITLQKKKNTNCQTQSASAEKKKSKLSVTNVSVEKKFTSQEATKESQEELSVTSEESGLVEIGEAKENQNSDDLIASNSISVGDKMIIKVPLSKVPKEFLKLPRESQNISKECDGNLIYLEPLNSGNESLPKEKNVSRLRRCKSTEEQMLNDCKPNEESKSNDYHQQSRTSSGINGVKKAKGSLKVAKRESVVFNKNLTITVDNILLNKEVVRKYNLLKSVNKKVKKTLLSNNISNRNQKLETSGYGTVNHNLKISFPDRSPTFKTKFKKPSSKKSLKYINTYSESQEKCQRENDNVSSKLSLDITAWQSKTELLSTEAVNGTIFSNSENTGIKMPDNNCVKTYLDPCNRGKLSPENYFKTSTECNRTNCNISSEVSYVIANKANTEHPNEEARKTSPKEALTNDVAKFNNNINKKSEVFNICITRNLETSQTTIKSIPFQNSASQMRTSFSSYAESLESVNLSSSSGLSDHGDYLLEEQDQYSSYSTSLSKLWTEQFNWGSTCKFDSSNQNIMSHDLIFKNAKSMDTFEEKLISRDTSLKERRLSISTTQMVTIQISNGCYKEDTKSVSRIDNNINKQERIVSPKSLSLSNKSGDIGDVTESRVNVLSDVMLNKPTFKIPSLPPAKRPPSKISRSSSASTTSSSSNLLCTLSATKKDDDAISICASSIASVCEEKRPEIKEPLDDFMSYNMFERVNTNIHRQLTSSDTEKCSEFSGAPIDEDLLQNNVSEWIAKSNSVNIGMNEDRHGTPQAFRKSCYNYFMKNKCLYSHCKYAHDDKVFSNILSLPYEDLVIAYKFARAYPKLYCATFSFFVRAFTNYKKSNDLIKFVDDILRQDIFNKTPYIQEIIMSLCKTGNPFNNVVNELLQNVDGVPDRSLIDILLEIVSINFADNLPNNWYIVQNLLKGRTELVDSGLITELIKWCCRNKNANIANLIIEDIVTQKLTDVDTLVKNAFLNNFARLLNIKQQKALNDFMGLPDYQTSIENGVSSDSSRSSPCLAYTIACNAVAALPTIPTKRRNSNEDADSTRSNNSARSKSSRSSHSFTFKDFNNTFSPEAQRIRFSSSSPEEASNSHELDQRKSSILLPNFIEPSINQSLAPYDVSMSSHNANDELPQEVVVSLKDVIECEHSLEFYKMIQKFKDTSYKKSFILNSLAYLKAKDTNDFDMVFQVINYAVQQDQEEDEGIAFMLATLTVNTLGILEHKQKYDKASTLLFLFHTDFEKLVNGYWDVSVHKHDYSTMGKYIYFSKIFVKGGHFKQAWNVLNLPELQLIKPSGQRTVPQINSFDNKFRDYVVAELIDRTVEEDVPFAKEILVFLIQHFVHSEVDLWSHFNKLLVQMVSNHEHKIHLKEMVNSIIQDWYRHLYSSVLRSLVISLINDISEFKALELFRKCTIRKCYPKIQGNEKVLNISCDMMPEEIYITIHYYLYKKFRNNLPVENLTLTVNVVDIRLQLPQILFNESMKLQEVKSKICNVLGTCFSRPIYVHDFKCPPNSFIIFADCLERLRNYYHTLIGEVTKLE